MFSALYQNHPKRCNVGDTLRALIYDEEGNEVNPEDVDAEIQWFADGVEITDATDAEYTVLVGDEGVVLSVEVTIGDETYTAETEKVEAAEVEELTVSIDNTTPKVGDILTAEVVDRNGEDVSDNVTFQWYADDVAIEGADEETLVVDDELLGAALKVVVTAENGNTFESEATEAVAAAVEELTVSIDNTTPKVGDTLTAKVIPPAYADTATYQWLADGVAIEGATKDTLLITKDYVGKKLSVTVTAADGTKATSAETKAVATDKSEDVSIIDLMGLQSDGTGIVGDTLRVSYGATFGTPTAITWYKDGAVLTTASVGDQVAALLSLNIDAAKGVGTYKATVVANGETYETNEILITNKEEAAKITAFSVEDDYTDGTDIVYDDDDYEAVATATLAKNYEGKFQIWEEKDTKYGSQKDSLKTATPKTKDPSVKEAKALTTADGSSVITADAATNYDALNVTNLGSGLGHINADGTVTYKWAFTGTRGTKYVVTFDQDSVLTDNPTTGTANVFATAATVPYVTTPAKIAITKVANNNAPEVTFQDANGNALTWMNGETGYTLAATGFDSATIYKTTAKTTDAKADTVSALADADKYDIVKAGVWTAGALADDTAFWFAEVKTTKGIFGEASVTLTSECVPIAQNVASEMNLVQNKDTATTATVKFANLRAPGTVYIVRGGDSDWDAADLYAHYTNNETKYIVGSSKVAAGAESVDIAKAISTYDSASGKYGKNLYIAVFIPDDAANYGMVWTNSAIFNENTKVLGKDDKDWKGDPAKDGDSAGVLISQAPTSLAFNKQGSAKISLSDGVISIFMTNVVAKDQFGEAQVTDMTKFADVDSVVATDKTITSQERGSAKYFVGVNGDGDRYTNVLLTLAGNTDYEDGYTVNFLGSALTVMNKSAAKGTLDKKATSGWEVKLGGDKVVDAADGANDKYVETATALKDAAAAADGTTATTITLADDITMDAALSLKAKTTLVIPSGTTLDTAAFGATIAATAVVENDGVWTASGGTITNNGLVVGAGDENFTGVTLAGTGTWHPADDTMHLDGCTINGGEFAGHVEIKGNTTINEMTLGEGAIVDIKSTATVAGLEKVTLGEGVTDDEVTLEYDGAEVEDLVALAVAEFEAEYEDLLATDPTDADEIAALDEDDLANLAEAIAYIEGLTDKDKDLRKALADDLKTLKAIQTAVNEAEGADLKAQYDALVEVTEGQVNAMNQAALEGLTDDLNAFNTAFAAASDEVKAMVTGYDAEKLNDLADWTNHRSAQLSAEQALAGIDSIELAAGTEIANDDPTKALVKTAAEAARTAISEAYDGWTATVGTLTNDEGWTCTITWSAENFDNIAVEGVVVTVAEGE